MTGDSSVIHLSQSWTSSTDNHLILRKEKVLCFKMKKRMVLNEWHQLLKLLKLKHRKIFSWSTFKNSSSRILQMLPPKCLLKIKCLKYQILFLVYLPKKETFSTFLLFFASVTYLNNKINWTFWVPNEQSWRKFLN